MNVKKYFGLFNIKNYILDAIDNFTVDTKTLVTDEEKKQAATKLINMVSKLSGAVSLQPLPFADTLIITPIQVSLVLKIAKIYGRDLDKKVVHELVATLIKAIAARTLAKSIVKYIPIIGAPAYFTISYIATHSMGLTAIRVFENKDIVEMQQIKESFEKEFNKTAPVNVVIASTLTTSEDNREPVLKVSKDLKTVHAETRSTIIYLPSEN